MTAIRIAPDSLPSLLTDALALDHHYSDEGRRKASLKNSVGSDVREAATLALIGFSSHRNEATDPQILLTERTGRLVHHQGQIAFPGGAQDKEDHQHPDYPVQSVTALRETHEEVGIAPDHVSVIGELPQIFIPPSRFHVTPVVGVLNPPISECPLQVNSDEIESAQWISLSDLNSKSVYRRELFRTGGRDYPNHIFEIDSYRIWGATGAMIRNLLDRILIVASHE